ncbi:MAG: type IV pilin [Candidatus Kariarchaeaceae archaeon]
MDIAKLKRKQKAVSPIIAVVLLIALVIISVGAVATMVFFFLQTDEGANEHLSISLDAFFDLDGDGAADAAVFKVNNEDLEPITIANATLGIGNDTISGATWSKLTDIFPDRIPSAGTVYVVISTYSLTQQFTLGSTFVFNFTLANEYFVSGTVLDIYDDGELVFGITSGGEGALLPKVMKYMAFKEDGEGMLAEGDPIEGAQVTIYDAASGFPASIQETTNVEGNAIFKIRAGRYFAKVTYGENSITSGDFNYPASADQFGKQNDQAISITGSFNAVNVHYSEEDVPTEGATIRVHKKVEIDGVVTEQLLEDNELTDWNGTASFALPTEEYRFLAYRGSPIPAMSDWVNIANDSDVYINTEPGIIYVRVLSANGIIIPNVKVTVLGVLDGSTTYLGEKYTNATGVVQFAIATPDFKVKVAYGAEIYVSSMFKVVPETVYDFYLGGNMLTVNATSQADNPVSNVYVMLYDEFGRYFGSAQTNSSGMATFFGLSNGSYHLKYYVGDTYFTTEIFDIYDDLIYDILIEGIITYANVRFYDTDTPVPNQFVYIYDAINGTFFGYGSTNTSGIATIITTVPENTTAHLRTWFVWDGISTQSISDLFNITDGLVVTIYFGGETVDVHVQDENGRRISRRYVYAYNEDGTIHSSSYLDRDGDGVFVFSPKALFTVGIDYGGVIIESPLFNSSETSYVLLEIPLDRFDVHVVGLDGRNLRRAPVYLYSYTDNWVLIDYDQRTNGRGIADFEAVEGGTYRVYVIASGYNFYSSSFTISEGITIEVAPLSMTVAIENSIGDPITGQWFKIYNEDGLYSGFATTDSSGEAEVIIFDGESYYIEIPALKYTSDVFIASDGGLETITLDLLAIYVQYQDERGEPFAPVGTYLSSIYNEDNSYAGEGSINSSGIGTYYVIENANYTTILLINGREIKSELFTATDGVTQVVVIDGYDLYVKVIFGVSPLVDGSVFIYNAGDQYTGNSVTNASGIAKFQFVLDDISYYLKVDTGGVYQTSELFNVTYNGFVYNFTITTVDISFKAFRYPNYDQGVRRLLVNIYNAINKTLAGTGTTDNQGIATITLAENQSYIASIYYRRGVESEVYSNIFYANSSTPQIDVMPVQMTVQVNDGSGAGVDSIYVRLLNQGITSGTDSLTDITGEAVIWANNGTSYYYLVGKDFYREYTYLSDGEVIGIDGNSTTIDIGGGSFVVLVNDNNGDPISGASVYLYTKSGDEIYYWTGYSAVTNSTGHASFIGVGGGQYVAYCPANGLYSEVFAAADGIVIILDASVVLLNPMVQLLGSNLLMIPVEESA